jgi:hypothetical protein
VDHPKKTAGYLIAAAILSGGFAAGVAAPAAAEPSVACAAGEQSSMVKTGEEALAVGAVVATGCSGA